jgi:hypothetical protein
MSGEIICAPPFYMYSIDNLQGNNITIQGGVQMTYTTHGYSHPAAAIFTAMPASAGASLNGTLHSNACPYMDRSTRS